ncbi:MAG: MFS transporter [Nanoarchaeota archaeon]|nr:MFS transporter [Nanoarchaeota archaeon]
MMIAYTLITSLIQLYVLQILTGITTAMQMTMEAAFLGDVTKKESRGRDIGKYHALVGIMAAVAIMGGGFVVGNLGFKVIFYITASLVFISTAMLFYIEEKRIISKKIQGNKHKSHKFQ